MLQELRFFRASASTCCTQTERQAQTAAKKFLGPILRVSYSRVWRLLARAVRHGILTVSKKREWRFMKKDGFATSFTVNQSPQEVFNAINNVRGWWSGSIDGETDELGAEFTYRYKDFHRSKQKVTELVPGKRVVWHVTDADLSSFNSKTEWTGTDIIFEIERKGDTTELRFTHVGLVPAFECYGDCSGAWGALVGVNLRNLIATGKNQPDIFA